MSMDEKNGEAFPYNGFVSGSEEYFSGCDLSCGHLKQLADDATAAVKWSGGGLNMTPLGSFEPSLHNDALVGNYRRAKLCDKCPARAKAVYEYHLDAGGRCVAALLHNSADKQAEWGPYSQEVYFCGTDGQTVYYCCYDGNDPDWDLSRGPSWLYVYSQFREGVPQLSLIYNARCP